MRNNKACRKTILGMQWENPWVMEPVVCNINLNAVYNSWLLLSDKTVILWVVGEQKLQSEAEYIFEIFGAYMFYFIACFPFILILRDLFFFADFMPVKGAIWRALGIEGFCFLINKHSKCNRKVDILILPSTHLPLASPGRLSMGEGLCRPVFDRKTAVTCFLFHIQNSKTHQHDWNFMTCLYCCYL